LGLDLAALIAGARVVPVEGELPDRLEAADFAGVRAILHAAGSTVFHANGSGEPARTNVEGTQALLHLADQAGVRRFVLVSTAYVCGAQTGSIPERISPQRPPIRNDYERSKWEAEQLVSNWWTPDRTATLCRPSILFGETTTGRATAITGLYLVARATEILARATKGNPDADRHQIPLRILGRSDATCNVVPIDWAARHIAHLCLHPPAGRSVHHITNPHPPSHQEVKEWLEEYFDIGGGRFSDETWPLADANHYEDIFYSLGNILLDYFRHGLDFESHLTGDLPPDRRLVDRESFFRCLGYAQESNWCRTPAKLGNPRLPGGQIDPRWYFEEFLPLTVPRSKVAQVEALTAVVRYTITGPSQWEGVCRFEGGRLEETRRAPTELVEEFEYRLSYEDFENVVTRKKPLQDVFYHGSAEMTGDVERALKMVPIIDEFLKEFPVAHRPTASPC
ncbi:MAG: SDR family oxidoreductase, partial [Phycisphaerae bacterium]